jgi:hypothetical protein
MRTCNTYFDLARKRHCIKSDSELSRRLGVSHVNIVQIRAGKRFPTGAQMLVLADLCGIDRKEALAELDYWRETDPATKATYAAMLNFFRGVAGALIASAAILASDPAQAAGTLGQHCDFAAPVAMYYATIRRRLRNLLARIGATRVALA